MTQMIQMMMTDPQVVDHQEDHLVDRLEDHQMIPQTRGDLVCLKDLMVLREEEEGDHLVEDRQEEAHQEAPSLKTHLLIDYLLMLKVQMTDLSLRKRLKSLMFLNGMAMGTRFWNGWMN